MKILNATELDFVFEHMANVAIKDALATSGKGSYVVITNADLEAAKAQIGALLKEVRRVGGVESARLLLKKQHGAMQPALFS